MYTFQICFAIGGLPLLPSSRGPLCRRQHSCSHTKLQQKRNRPAPPASCCRAGWPCAPAAAACPHNRMRGPVAVAIADVSCSTLDAKFWLVSTEHACTRTTLFGLLGWQAAAWPKARQQLIHGCSRPTADVAQMDCLHCQIIAKQLCRVLPVLHWVGIGGHQHRRLS